MKNVRSKRKLTLDTETLRSLRGIAVWELRRAQGGEADPGTSPCTQWQFFCPKTGEE